MSSTQNSTRKALRLSLILPVVILLGILIIGVILFQIIPADQSNNALSILVGGSMVLFLAYWTRNANWQLRLIALLLALPALAGITASLLRGSSQYIVIGVGTTFLLLLIQRAFTVPPSYRVATRHFNNGNYEGALNLINKTIASRPDFADAYQLRAMIRLIYKQFPQAEEDARQAIAKQPNVYTNFNTLGQIYLAESRYDLALNTFEKAIALEDTVAMNHYHHGLSAYRLEQFQQAAESLSQATKKTLPLIEYDLLAHFYLYQSLIQIKQEAIAQEALTTLQKFADGLPQLEALVENEAEYEHVLLMKEDIATIEQLLPSEQ